MATHSHGDAFSSMERTCPICKKFFIVPPLNVYKLHVGGKITHYCSYSCFKKAKEPDGRKNAKTQQEKVLEKCVKIAEGGAVK